jgi:hypothetical protein
MDDLYLDRLRAKYNYFVLEEKHQKNVFNDATAKFDKYFKDKLDIAKTGKEASAKIKEDIIEPKERGKYIDKIYKKLALKVHPDTKTGNHKDFTKLKKIVDRYDFDEIMIMAVKYDVDVSDDVDWEELYLSKLKILEDKILGYSVSLVMQWYNVDDDKKENLEKTILKNYGKSKNNA